MIATANRKSKVLSTGSYASDRLNDITATTGDDSTGVIFSGQMVSYLTPSTFLFVDEYSTGFYDVKSYRPRFVPAHRRKNPFERLIHKEIVKKHEFFVKETSKNVTFNRQNMKGFV